MKIFGEIVIGLGLGVVPPLIAPAQPEPVPCVCGSECKCAAGTCGGGCPSVDTVWLTSYADAVRVRDLTGQPVVLLFTDPVGCLPCRQFESGALSDPAVKKAMRGTINVRVDVRTAEGSRLASQFNVTAWPQMIVYKNGKLAGSRTGNVSSSEVLQILR